MRHMTPAKSARLNRSAYGRTSDALGLDNDLGLTPSTVCFCVHTLRQWLPVVSDEGLLNHALARV